MMTDKEIAEFVRGRIARLEDRLATGRRSGSINQLTIARLEGRIDSLDEIAALLEVSQ